MARITIEERLAARLEEHAGDADKSSRELVEELVRDYLDGTGPWKEIEGHLATIHRLGRELADLHAQIRRVVEGLPPFAQYYDTLEEARAKGAVPR